MSDINVVRKQNDLKKLIKIFKIINEIKIGATNSDLIKILVNIGELAGRISFNNKDSDCIRNKYGCIQRVSILRKNEESGFKVEETHVKINGDGIDFKKLENLKQTLLTLKDTETDSVFKDCYERQILIKDLYNLQMKIAYVLDEENEMTSNVDLENQIKALRSIYNPKEHQISNIIHFSSQRYKQMAFKRIHEEISSFDIINLSRKEDLYYFGRIFTIIGELFHEINTDQTIEKNDNLLKAFENLNNTRDLLIHHHKSVENFKDSKEELERIISNLQRDLLKIIKEEKQNTFVIENNELDLSKSLQINSEKLNLIIKSKSTQIEESNISNKSTNSTNNTTNTNNKAVINSTATDIIKSKNILVNLIILLANTLNSQNSKNRDKLWKLLNTSYQKINKQVTKPEPFSEAGMEKLIKGLEILYDEIRQHTIILQEQNDDQEIVENLSKELETLNFINSLSKHDKKEIIKFGDELNKKRELDNYNKKKKIDEETNNKKIIILRSKIKNILGKINNEMEYLKETEKQQMESNKQAYVMDHIIALIGQYQRDLDDAYYELLKLGDNLTSPRPTNVSFEASVSAKTVRSSELVHNVLNLNRKALLKRIKEDILPAQRHFDAIAVIYEHEYGENKIMPKSVLIYYRLGSCYFYVNMFNNAVKCYEESFKLINKHKIDFLQYLICTGENVCCIHLYTNTTFNFKENINDLHFLLIETLAKCYNIINDQDKVNDLLQPIYEQIQSIKIKETVNLCRDCSYLLYFTCEKLIKYLFNKQDKNYEKPLKLLEKLTNNIDKNIKLIDIYIKLNKYAKAKELIKIILSDSNLNLLQKYLILSFKHSVLECSSEDDEYVNGMKEVLLEFDELKRNEHLFKELFGDHYVSIDFEIICLNLKLINKYFGFEKKNNCEIQSMIIEVENKIDKLYDYSLKLNGEIFNYNNIVFLLIILVYCNIIKSNIVINSEDEFNKIFEKAKHYLNKMITNNDPYKNEAVIGLASACGNYAFKHASVTGPEPAIKYLKRSLDIIKQYNLDANNVKVKDLSVSLSIDLSLFFFRIVCSSSGNEHNSSDKRRELLENYKKSINYLQEIHHNAVIKFNDNHQIYFFTNSILPKCYNKTAIIRNNFESKQKVLLYYEKVTELINIQIELFNKVIHKNEEINKLKPGRENYECLQFSDYLKFDYKILLLTTYIKFNKQEEGNMLIEIILKNPKLKFYLICDTIQDPIEFTRKIKKILLELNLEDNELRQIYDNHTLINLFFTYLKIISFNKNLILIIENQNWNVNNLRLKLIELEDEFYNLTKNLTIIDKNISQLLNSIYIHFIVSFYFMFQVISSEAEFDEMFEKAKNYLNKLNNDSDQHDGAYPLALTAWYYATKCLSENENEKRIKYCKQAIDIIRQFKSEIVDIQFNNLNVNLLINLGVEYYNLGKKYNSWDRREESLENYNRSINYLQQIEHDPSIEFTDKLLINNLLGECYSNTGIMECDLESIQKVLFYYEKVSELINAQIELLKIETHQSEEIQRLEEKINKSESLKQHFEQTLIEQTKIYVDMWFVLKQLFNLFCLTLDAQTG